MSNEKRQWILPCVLGAGLVVAMLVAAGIGVIPIPVKVIGQSIGQKFGLFRDVQITDYYQVTLWQLRIPRIVMSVLAGAALAICGGVFQSIFRNPVCDPYILGISSGASLGAAVAFILGWDAVVFGITLPALVTALLTLLLILGIARLKGKHNTNTLLLIGIALNFFISAVITLLVVVNQKEMHKIYFWTMGSLAHVSWLEIAWLIPVMVLCVGILFYYAKAMNIMQVGEETALTLGIDTRRTTYAVLITSSIMISVVVAFCGSIGFIGLIMPHVARILFGSNNRRLFTYSLFFGAFFLLVADTLARTVAAPAELPVGSITALAGAPYFIYLVLRKR
ncbi:MAG: iron ABC transporter permease [Bacteroidales bacterium]|nr:iron ABC transporter permease [Bacteroidales bacterium]